MYGRPVHPSWLLLPRLSPVPGPGASNSSGVKALVIVKLLDVHGFRVRICGGTGFLRPMPLTLRRNARCHSQHSAAHGFFERLAPGRRGLAAILPAIS